MAFIHLFTVTSRPTFAAVAIMIFTVSCGQPWLFATAAPVTVQILPHTSSVPLGRIGAFNCASNDTFLGWLVTLPGQSPLVPNSSPNIANLLKNNGVFYEAGLPLSIRINGSEGNNGTKIECMAIRDTTTSSDSITVTVYGRPEPPPVVQRAAQYDLGITVIWDPPSPLFAASTYWLTVQDLWDASAVTAQMGPLTETHCTYRHLNRSTACHRYQFTVVAENAVGRSDSSKALVTQIPQVPQFNTTVRSKAHISNGSLVISVTFDPAQACQDFSIRGYGVELTDVVNNSTLHFGPYSAPTNSTPSTTEITFRIQDGLIPNRVYSCIIDAFNIVGRSSTSPSIVYTTDVASVTVTANCSQLEVTCFFIEGSRARGCVVLYETPELSVEHMIPRLNDTAVGTVALAGSDCYNVSVVDWEEDGTVGSVAVSALATPSQVNYLTDCGNREKTTTPESSSIPPAASSRSVPLLPIIFTLLLLLVAVTAAIVAAAFIYYCKRHSIEEYSPRRETIKDMIRASKRNGKLNIIQTPSDLTSFRSSANMYTQKFSSSQAHGTEEQGTLETDGDTIVVRI